MSDSSSELQGWKEIASYLGRSMRAAQRWETQYGLPVRRIGGTVFADRAELDAWKRSPPGQSAARAPGATDEDDAAHVEPATTPRTEPGPPAVPAATSTPAVEDTGPPPVAPRPFAGWRVWLTAAGVLGALTVAAILLLTLGDSTAGWLGRRAPAAPVAGWDRIGLDQGPWPASNHDARLSAQGHTLGPADPAPAKLLLDPGGPLIQSDEMIATSHGVVITGTCDGRVFAVRPDGSLAWVQSLDRQHNAEAAAGFAVGVQASGLAVPTGECPHNVYANVRTQLHVLRAQDGASIFRLRTGAMTIPPAIALTTTLYQIDQYNTLRAVDILGDVKWTVDLPGFTASPPVQGADGTLYVATDGSTYGHRSVWALSPLGKPLWNEIAGLLVRMALGEDGHLYAVDANSDIAGRPQGPYRLLSLTTAGDLRWQVEFAGWRWAGVRDTLAVGPSGPVVRVGDAVIALTPDGAERWRVPLAPRAPAVPGPILDRDENAYFSAGDEVISVGRDGRERWRVGVPQAGRIILAGEGLLAVTSANRRVFLVHDKGVEPRRSEAPGAI